MDASQLNMLHNRRHKGVGSISDGIGLGFGGVFEEFINQDGSFRCYFHRGSNILL